MFEFVLFTGPDDAHDLEKQKRIRSHAMRDYRHRQRQSRNVRSNLRTRLTQRVSVETGDIEHASDNWQYSRAPLQPRTLDPQTRAPLIESAIKSRQRANGHSDTAQDRRLSLQALSPMRLYGLSYSPQVDGPEQRNLHYFHHVVMTDIAGPICVGFWDRMIPQLCQSENVVRQAVLALSQTHAKLATHRNLSQSLNLYGEPPALHNPTSYMRASRTLRTYLERSALPSYTLVLTCNIIFHAIETLHGAQRNALCHLENGLAMFKAWQRQRDLEMPQGEDGFSEIATVFARLDLSATIADDDRVPCFTYDSNGPPSISCVELPVQTRLTSPHDAHYQLMKVGTPAWEFLIRNKQWRDVHVDSVPDEVVNQQRLHKNRYRAWSIAMDSYEWEQTTCRREKNPKAEERGHSRSDRMVSLLATRMHHW